MSRVAWTGAAIGIALTIAGCGGAQRRSSTALDDVERARRGAGAQEGARLAPQTYAVAEDERKRAREAEGAGDDVGADLHAQRAIAAYQHALVVARLARATVEQGKAKDAEAAAEGEARRLAQSRAEIDREGDELDKRLHIARETLAPAPSGPADATRDAARWAAARALATQARLLCGAARLLGASLPGLAGAEAAVSEVEKKTESPGRGEAMRSGAAIDAAARARAGCLAVLTKSRRSAAGGSAGQGDTLLAELSAAGGWAPVRDERGVVVTLRDPFQGSALTRDAAVKLQELGRVLSAHAGHAAQVVVHDATPPDKAQLAVDAQRGDAAVQALAAGAGSAAHVKAELAGARAPLVDPADTAHRARNVRVDVVFVTPAD